MERFKIFIIRLLRRHHPWREIGYDELSELYIGMMFRGFAMSIIGIFIPLYLLGLGYPVISIVGILAWHFSTQIVSNYIAARTIASIGPKHTILLSYVVHILVLGMFLTLPLIGWPIWVLGAMWGAANSFFWVAYHVDFSKIKHTENGGKELGTISMLQRFGYALGPLIGGILASFWGAPFAFIVATILLFVGLIPLLSTGEPTRIHRKLHFRDVLKRGIWRDSVSVTGVCVEDMATTYFWPLFISLFVLGGPEYAELGLISTISTLVSIGAARVIGQQTDRNRGRALLQTGLLGSAGVQMLRPFITSLKHALGLNILSEIFAVSYSLPFYKGLYDDADQWRHHRIEFVTVNETVAAIVRSSICWFVVLCLNSVNVTIALSIPFVFAALAACVVVLVERFKALD